MRKSIRGLLIVFIMLLAGCGSTGQTQDIGEKDASAVADSATGQGGYEVQSFLDSGFHEENAIENDGVLFDASGASQGYVAVKATADSRLKLQVEALGLTYTYDLPNDGTATVFPLQCGNGSYTFTVLQNQSGNSYFKLWEGTEEVALKDEFQPFLRPSQMVDYSESSACVTQAKQLAAGAANDTELVAAVYAYVSETVQYDNEKAASVQNGYLPSPDATLRDKKGICFDYAALAAAMLRSVGVPTQLAVGNAGDIYHAWNLVYLKNEGWIAVEIKASANRWQRMDTTFASTGAGIDFLTNDANYVELYIY